MVNYKDMNQVKLLPSTTKLWLPVSIAIGSPYLLLSNQANIELSEKNIQIEDILNSLICPPDEYTNDYFKTEIGKACLNYVSFVLSDFWRKSIDKRYPCFKPKKHTAKKIKDAFRLEAELVCCLWEIIKDIQSRLSMPSPIIFQKIFSERKIIFFNMISETDKKSTKTEYIRIFQAQNKKLQNYENPFDEKISPYTSSFMQICILEADRSNVFRTKYSNMVRARMTLTNYMRVENTQVNRENSKNTERRGRKSYTRV